jgi:hypothetical protein
VKPAAEARDEQAAAVTPNEVPGPRAPRGWRLLFTHGGGRVGTVLRRWWCWRVIAPWLASTYTIVDDALRPPGLPPFEPTRSTRRRDA